MTDPFHSFEDVYSRKLTELRNEYPAFIKAINEVLTLRFTYASQSIVIAESQFNFILERYVKELHPEIDLLKVHRYDHKHVVDFLDILRECNWSVEVTYTYGCHYIFSYCLGRS